MNCAFPFIATDADLLPFFISKCPMSVPRLLQKSLLSCLE